MAGRRCRARAADLDRGRSSGGRAGRSAQRLRAHAHPDLPSGRARGAGGRATRRLRGRPARAALRPQEPPRLGLLPAACASGALALAAAPDRLRQRRSVARDLLDPDCRGLPVRALPHPARGHVPGQRRRSRRALPARADAHPSPQPVRLQGLRHVALFRRREADAAPGSTRMASHGKTLLAQRRNAIEAASIEWAHSPFRSS